MEKKDKTILVTGSTGQQGGAVARHLLKDGWKVRAFVRDEKKESAIELEKSGAELFKGDMNDSESLDKAMEGIYGVFSIQNFWEHGYDGELNHGKAVADAAKKANVQHFLQSSVGGAERNTKLPHFDVKFEIEKYLKSLNLPVTVIRPVFFMENFKTWFKPVEADGKLTLNMAMKADTKLQMIAVDDIGAISAKIFDNPDKFIGKEIELAGDELTMPEVAALYETNTGKKTEFVELPVSVIRTNSEEMADMFQWFIDKGYEADLKTQKDLFGKTISFKEWLQ
ncbi:MAG: NmrA/HSCARG family protein [Ignavibacteria bacterium]|nr:NmrA/HSCARG family protein [Ignavibacteria bacterium]MBL0108296.1 NmrA/HSCARG family protein [Ignavibacteria bacterium]